VEVGTYRSYDKVVVVTCPPKIQRERLRERSGLTPEQIETRIASQMPMEEKVKVADFVIDNSGDIGRTHQQVEDVYRQLRALA
jgi:dephospho-CoA kinase